MARKLCMILVMVGLAAHLGGVAATYSMRGTWRDLVTGPATGDDTSCCYSAACASDNHCVAASCQNEPASECSAYSCYHCECCPCCGEGQYCFSESSTPFSHGTCCPNGYKGPDCKQPICTESCNHGTCSAPNKCTCEPGYSGPVCNTASCDGGCGHGTCTGPNKCTCSAGWTGANCSSAVCDGGCGHGSCTAPNECACDKDWSGPHCSKPVCPAGCVHGTCSAPNTCTCDKGWEGTSCNACIPDPFTFSSKPGNFTVATVEMGGCTWKAGTQASLTVKGVALKKILAGHVAWKLYEASAQHFVSSGTSNYFMCTNKGCNPAAPVALVLENPDAVPTNYTLTFDFVMPAVVAGALPSYQLYAYGEDQDHFPYDFDLTVAYNYTTAAPAQPQFSPNYITPPPMPGMGF